MAAATSSKLKLVCSRGSALLSQTSKRLQSAQPNNKYLLDVPQVTTKISDKVHFAEDTLDVAHRMAVNVRRGVVDAVDLLADQDGMKTVDFNTCDYLNLCHDPRINKAHADAVLRYGGCNHNAPHNWPRGGDSLVTQFEEKAADWIKMESTVLSKSCNEANLCVFQSVLRGTDTPVYCDKLIHASIRLALKVGGPRKVLYFKHNDTDDLMRLIKENGPGIIAIESVYSQLGTVVPLERMVNLANDYGCAVFLDESHSIGNIGKDGEGLMASLNLSDGVHFFTASLGKTLGCMAGLIGCSEENAYIMKNSATPMLFSFAMQDELGARLLKALEITIDEKWRREELWRGSRFMRENLYNLGYEGRYVKEVKESPIIAMVPGPEERTIDIMTSFMDNDVNLMMMTYPLAPMGKSLIRLVPNLTIPEHKYQHAIDVFAEMRDKIKPWTWRDYQASQPLF